MRAPSTGNSYFEFQLQTSPTKAIRAICYSPEKRPKIKDMQEKRIAVSIDNVQETIGRRRASEEEYTIRKKSRITPQIVSYQYDTSFSQMFFSISEIEKISDFQPISVKAKILQKSDSETVSVRGNALKKFDVVIADETKAIKLTVWENILNLDFGKSYIIEGVSVRSFNDEKYLTTTKYTVAKETENIISIEQEQPDSYGKVLIASVVAISVSTYKSCIICNTKLQVDEDSASTIKCGKCKLTTFVNELLDSSITKLVLKDDLSYSLYTYTVLNTTMNTFLQKFANKIVTDFSESELLNLFSGKKFQFTVSEKEKLVSQIKYA